MQQWKIDDAILVKMEKSGDSTAREIADVIRKRNGFALINNISDLLQPREEETVLAKYGFVNPLVKYEKVDEATIQKMLDSNDSNAQMAARQIRQRGGITAISRTNMPSFEEGIVEQYKKKTELEDVLVKRISSQLATLIKTTSKSLSLSFQTARSSTDIKQSNISEYITSQIDTLKQLNQKAQSAQKAQKGAQQAAENALSDAGRAWAKAKKAAELSAGLFKKKKAIVALQVSNVEIGKALNELAEAQLRAMDAQCQLALVQQSIIQYQEKVTEVSQILLKLGAFSIAQNRSTVRELEMRLKGASEAEIGDLAKQELQAVYIQLKQQLDLVERMDSLEKKLGEMMTSDKEVSQIALKLGTINAAQTRGVVHELEMKLQGASKEEIGDPTKQELQTLFIQLKQQLDLFERVDRIEDKLREMNAPREENDN